MYFDKSVPFGSRYGAKYMQETTSAASKIMLKFGIKLIPYIDDFGGVAKHFRVAQSQYATTHIVFKALGLKVAHHKSTPPATVMTWLGVSFDSWEMSMTIPMVKLEKVVAMCHLALSQDPIELKLYKSLMGKLLHIAYILRDVRLF